MSSQKIKSELYHKINIPHIYNFQMVPTPWALPLYMVIYTYRLTYVFVHYHKSQILLLLCPAHILPKGKSQQSKNKIVAIVHTYVSITILDKCC